MNFSPTKSLFFISILLCQSASVLAGTISYRVTKEVEVGNFPVGVGSEFVLNSEEAKINGQALFLGNVISPDGSPAYRMFLNKSTKKVYYINSSNFSRENSNYQMLLDPHEQAGGTCTGYAIDNFLMQTNLTGFYGTGELEKELSTEEGRTHLLVDAVNQYYMVQSHRNSIRGILNGYGKKFGLTCKMVVTDNYEKAKLNLIKQLQKGLPVIISFPIGPKMVNSPFALSKLDEPKNKVDDRLWIPRKVGERNAGGHSIVAASYFTFNNKTYLMMIDSDWNEPRIWDMDSFLNNKTALDEVEFISCNEKDL